ncbi:NADH-quinone oxidoreductase subunit L [Alphaproteobacteria bacterium]|nr:NADH-quinone oxidoreductase subunit L [Alphaproteobacteria bacterium]
MFLVSVFLPLFSFLVCVFLQDNLPKKHLNFFSCLIMIIATIFSVCSLIFVQLNGESSIIISRWINSGNLRLDWSLQLNLLTASMVLMVNLVSTLIHIYSVGYMEKDPKRILFMAYLSLFTFFMLFLVSSSNLLQLFLGWEGVGLTSYLLIGFWNYKEKANSAALKAFIVNRVGDAGLLLALFTTFVVFGTLNISEIKLLINSQNESIFKFLGFDIHSLTLISLLLFIGCMGKSAQFGLHVWLPDAMEGPTPVSALIHAATMVTAGVFLLIVMSPLLESSEFSLNFILIVGSITCIFASSVAVFQNDIKRIIAYSTCSQLGYMFMAIGSSAYTLAYFHLLSHAFFKALLFLGAGSVIHSMSDEQDIKKMGGLYNKIPLTYITMLIGSLSLVGLPFLSGYYSKDLILEIIYLNDYEYSFYFFLMGVIGVLFTSIYSLRLLVYVFHRDNVADEKVIAHIHESPSIMILPLVILSIFAIFFGMFMKIIFTEFNFLEMWSSTMYVNKSLDATFISQNVPVIFKKLPLLMIVIGTILILILYFSFKNLIPFLKSRLSFFYNFFKNKWYVDQLYEKIFIKPTFYFGKGFWKSVDKELIDNLGPNGFSRIVLSFSFFVSRLQSGFLYHYVLSIIIGLTLLISLYTYIF